MTLQELNQLSTDQLRLELHRCCGSVAWVERMVSCFPVKDQAQLLEQSSRQWKLCNPEEWKEAFAHHPKIGDRDSLARKFASTAQWAAGEQQGVATATEEVIGELADGNKAYEEKFGYIFIVCATGKSAGDMLQLLKSRLHHDAETEIRIAAGEQDKITALRLQKLLS